MPNPFAHVELNTDDVKKAKKFYQTVFAWKLSDMPDMGGYTGYTMIDVAGGVGGGMQKKQSPDGPSYWLSYVMVDDVKATMAKATKAGATAVLPYQEIGDMGAIGIFVDPTGAHLGLWEAKQGAGAPPAPEKTAKKASKKAPAKKAAAKAAPPAEEKPAKKPAKKAPAKKAPAKAAKAAPAPAPAPAKKAPAKKAPKKG